MEIKETARKSGYEMVIRIREAGLPVVEEFNNGIKLSEGSYTHEKIAEALLQSTESPQIATPILPKGTIYFTQNSNDKTFCFIEVPPHKRELIYHTSKIKSVPYPRLVFGFQLLKREQHFVISEVVLGALENNVMSYEEALLYHYPYTNVYDTFKICWGSIELPLLNKVSQLSNIPDLFFSAPNSDCLYTNSNKSSLSFRELVESLKKKDFPDEHLRSTGKTLNQWMLEICTR